MYLKTVITGGVIEVTEYENLNVLGNGGYNPGDGKQSEENYKQRQRIRRNKVRQLITSNFDNKSKFYTLTFADTDEIDICNVQQCNAKFKDFIFKMRRKYRGFNYVSVVEFQDKNGRGAVHYHMLSDLPYIEQKDIERLWGNGYVFVNKVTHVDNIGAYVVKYMVADMDDKRLCGERAYLRSRGLQSPIEVCSWRDEDKEVLAEVADLLKRETPSYCSEYESEHAGLIRYFQYNMNRPKK